MNITFMQGRSAHHNHHDCTDTGCTKMDSQLWAPDGHVRIHQACSTYLQDKTRLSICDIDT